MYDTQNSLADVLPLENFSLQAQQAQAEDGGDAGREASHMHPASDHTSPSAQNMQENTEKLSMEAAASSAEAHPMEEEKSESEAMTEYLRSILLGDDKIEGEKPSRPLQSSSMKAEQEASSLFILKLAQLREGF